MTGVAVPAANGLDNVFSPFVADALRAALRPGLQDDPELDLDVVLDLATGIAVRRAELHDRSISPVDVEFVLSIFCRWPFKPPPPGSYKSDVDALLLPALIDGDVHAVANAILEVSLLLTIERLHALIESGLGNLLFVQA